MSYEQGGRERAELVFKSDDDKAKFMEEVNDFLNKEIKFDAFKIPFSEVEKITNMPPMVLSVMEKYGII